MSTFDMNNSTGDDNLYQTAYDAMNAKRIERGINIIGKKKKSI